MLLAGSRTATAVQTRPDQRGFEVAQAQPAKEGSMSDLASPLCCRFHSRQSSTRSARRERQVAPTDNAKENDEVLARDADSPTLYAWPLLAGPASDHAVVYALWSTSPKETVVCQDQWLHPRRSSGCQYLSESWRLLWIVSRFPSGIRSLCGPRW